MPEVPILTICSIPFLLIPPVTHRAAGLSSSPLCVCVCVGVITKMEGHWGQVCGELVGGEIHCTVQGLVVLACVLDREAAVCSIEDA